MTFFLKRFWIKLWNWEYWPAWTVYAAPMIFHSLLALKHKAFFYFSAVNPSIETGGMFFESKWEIFKLIPAKYLPTTIFIKAETAYASIEQLITETKLDFPIIAKPDRGERGQGVKKCSSMDELKSYLKKHPVDIILQEYIDLPLELSVFYVRHPNDVKGKITSLTKKELLHLKGNGVDSLKRLIYTSDRAFLQWEVLINDATLDMSNIPAAGEKRLLVPYGNHSRGAMFLNAEAEIDDALLSVFDEVSKSIPGFYYGRYDIRCRSMELLKQNKDWKIMELNGAGAEPAHIYQPGFSFFKAQKIIFQHFRMMSNISAYNHSRGAAYMSYSEFKALRKLERAYKQKLLGIS